MRPLITLRKIIISRKELMILALFLLLCKLSLVGVFVAKSGRLSSIPFVPQAVAQEETIEDKKLDTSGGTGDEEEFGVLTLLEKKRKELEGREEGLKQEEERLHLLKAEIEERLEKMAQTEKRIEKLIVLKETEEAKDLTKLAKVFEATPPEQAGPMFNKLDVDLAAKILVRMKGRSAGKIWGFVNPDQAVRISKELAKLK